MLSTGVDIPALEYIVFLRPVKSRILWTQMLGRGIRKCPDINKALFTIFDCFNGTLIQYFKDSVDFAIEIEESGSAVTLSQIIENIWLNVERDYNIKRLIKRLRRGADTMSAQARRDFAAFLPDGDVGKFADELRQNLKTDLRKPCRCFVIRPSRNCAELRPRPYSLLRGLWHRRCGCVGISV
jgi:type I restriction enzyme R subunit